MRRKKKEPRCKIGTDLNKSLQFKLLQWGAGHDDMHHVQPGLSNRPATNARASLPVAPVSVTPEQNSPFSHFSEGKEQISPYFASLSAWFGRAEI